MSAEHEPYKIPLPDCEIEASRAQLAFEMLLIYEDALAQRYPNLSEDEIVKRRDAFVDATGSEEILKTFCERVRTRNSEPLVVDSDVTFQFVDDPTLYLQNMADLLQVVDKVYLALPEGPIGT